MTLHNALTGVELHETKGAAAATIGQVLTATGGGAAVYALPLTKAVFVNALSDLPAAAAGKITLAAATTYIIGADINIGTDYLLFSNGSALQSTSIFSTTLTYTGTSPMLQGADADALIRDITITCASADLFSWADGGAGAVSSVIVLNLLVTACLGVGTFDKVRALSIDTVRVADCTSGLVFTGAVQRALVVNVLGLLSTSTSYVGFDFTGATLEQVDIANTILAGGAGSIGLKGDAASANIAASFIANITSVSFKGVTTPLSGITVDDIRYNFQGNGVVQDTFPDALLSLTANATATTLTVGVPTLVAGTWAIEREVHFTGTTGGRITYVGERDLVSPVDISIIANPASGTNKSLRVFLALNGTAIANSGKSVNISTGDPKEVTVHWQLTLAENDFVEVFIENETDSTDFTVIDASVRIK